MVRQITRNCDFCGKDVNPYGVGIVTLYREIRIGAGSRFVEHLDGLNIKKALLWALIVDDKHLVV